MTIEGPTATDTSPNIQSDAVAKELLGENIGAGIQESLSTGKPLKSPEKTSPSSGPTLWDQISYQSLDIIDTVAATCLEESRAEMESDQSGITTLFSVKDIYKSKAKERGRGLQRAIRCVNPLARAESRCHKDDVMLEVQAESIRSCSNRSESTFFGGRSNSCATLEALLLEPFPDKPSCNSVIEVMEGPSRNIANGKDASSPVAGFVRTNSHNFQDILSLESMRTGTSGHVSLDCGRLQSAPNLPCGAVASHRTDYDNTDYPSLMYSSRSYSRTKKSSVQLLFAHLPAEILYQIYFCLSPADFNSARHSCRSWYINSLELSLLRTMLKRGGWSTSMEHEITTSPFLGSQAQVNDEWTLSKLISRECALGPDWTGNGLYLSEDDMAPGLRESSSKVTPFAHISTTDFTECGLHYPNADESKSGISFTVSTCGKFLMVAHGCLVYIYELNRSHNSEADDGYKYGGALRPITCVICPRRVLACSMDTSSQRYAIAVLLDGRMGLVCDLTGIRSRCRRSSSGRFQGTQDTSTSVGDNYRNRVSISTSRSRGPYRVPTEQAFVFPVIAAEAALLSCHHKLRGPWEDMVQSGISSDSFHSVDDFQTGNQLSPSLMPIEPSNPTLFVPLCSAEDLPRSVALCPQRRCVAFGCSSGIELHWVDALTGQDLSRWFPLTAPSDYLYFLPPRMGVDSAKKLRLISSAGQPGERPVIGERFGGRGVGVKSAQASRSSPFWGVSSGRYDARYGREPVTTTANLDLLSKDNSDHYRAVPLSDGYHILFTDPATGLLCLGSDAPVGGPIKLLRKIWFASPQGEGSPVAYTGGTDLRWGVRVVAAYGQGDEQTIWLYSIPCDIFSEIQSEHGRANLPSAGTRFGNMNENSALINWWSGADISEWSDHCGASWAMGSKEGRPWPLKFRGQQIGQCHGLVDLVIDSGPIMTIWAFSRDGTAKTWQMNHGDRGGNCGKKYIVLQDGTIRASDSHGDIEMVDLPSAPSQIPSAARPPDRPTFDGTASTAASIHQPADPPPGPRPGPIICCNAVHYDADGDVLMADLPDAEHSSSGYASDDECSRPSDGGHRASAAPHLAAGSYWATNDGQDVVDALTGIARMDIEIR